MTPTDEKMFSVWFCKISIFVMLITSLWYMQAPGVSIGYNPVVRVTLALPEPEPSYTAEDVEWLAKNIYFEARNQSDEGQAAVAYVTINRMYDPGFPKTIKAVVLEKNHACQFSWTCERKSKRIYNTEAWEKALAIAQGTLEDRIPNPIGNSLFYHSRKVKPFRFLPGTQKLQIQDHVFYVARYDFAARSIAGTSSHSL